MTSLDYYLPELFLNSFLAASSTSLQGLTTTQVIVDIIQKGVTVVAICVGGFWAYFRFIQGRTFQARLEPQVSGKVATINGALYLIATIRVKNVGGSKVEIGPSTPGLRVWAYQVSEHPTAVKRVDQWEDLGTFPVFESGPVYEAQKWIEPGEEIKEQCLIAMPEADYTAFRLLFRMVSHEFGWLDMDTVMLAK
jgi:hypothetical protein